MRWMNFFKYVRSLWSEFDFHFVPMCVLCNDRSRDRSSCSSDYGQPCLSLSHWRSKDDIGLALPSGDFFAWTSTLTLTVMLLNEEPNGARLWISVFSPVGKLQPFQLLCSLTYKFTQPFCHYLSLMLQIGVPYNSRILILSEWLSTLTLGLLMWFCTCKVLLLQGDISYEGSV